MASLNPRATVEKKYTHGGAEAYPHMTPEQQLRRSVMSCLLWEDEFYEDGVKIADRITETAKKCPTLTVAELALEVRSKGNLRHVPLLLLCAVLEDKNKWNYLVSKAEYVSMTIQRADELSELLSVYWRNGRRPLANQLKKGLASAFQKFSPYQLAKYNRDNKIKLRDVLFLCHARPKDDEQAKVWKQLVDGTLASPDTWEVELSAGKAKKETFERLLREGKLGYLALLRNLRNMIEAKCDVDLVSEAILARKNGADKVLPFRFIAAAENAVKFEDVLDQALIANCSQQPKLQGKTVVVIDISGSMGAPLSKKSDMTRKLAACALGAVTRELCEIPAIYATAGNDGRRIHATAEVPLRRGMALVDAIDGMTSVLGGGGIFLNQVMKFITDREGTADRTIVITDEQDCSGAEDSPLNAIPLGRGYMINVASARNGIGYKPRWLHIDGFSERVLSFIQEVENDLVSNA